MRSVATLLLSVFLVAIAVLSTASPALAIEPGDPCQLDRQRLCGHVPSEGAAQRRCLIEQRAAAAPACRGMIDASMDRRARIPDARIACSEDASRLCADVQLGRGELGRCLREHDAELSAPCRDALRRHNERRPEP